MKLKYKILLAIITVGIGICLMAYQSYALWVASYTGGENIVEVGCFSVEFEELSSSVQLHNTYPVSDQKGLLLTPYTFKITNTCTNDAAYNVTLNTLTTNTMQKNWLKYAIYKSTESKPIVGINLGTISNFNTATEELQITNLDESIIIASGKLKQNESENYNFYLWMDEATGNEAMNTKFEGSINVISTAAKIVPTAVEEILAKGETEELAFDNTVDNNLRYIGANPNNYVSFNNELWRIIGVMNNIDDGTGKKETRLKIIRDDPIGSMAWNNYYTNNWLSSTLQQNLNGDFLNSLQSSFKNMIDNTKWNLGGSSALNEVTSSMFYERERGTTVYSGNAVTWIGKIGLMYPSDYGYATSGGSTTNRQICLSEDLFDWKHSGISDCKYNNWIYGGYQWTLTTDTTRSQDVFILRSDGSIDLGPVYDEHIKVFPSLHLNSNVKITGGSGTSTNPYILSL